MIIQNGSVIANRLPPKWVPTKLRLYQRCRSSTRAWRKSPATARTRMPAARNGGQTLRTRRRVVAETFRAMARRRSDQQQRRHPAAVAADHVLVLDHAEGVDQRLARQAVLEVAVAPEHFQELLEAGLGVAGDDVVHAQQVARLEVGGIGGDGRFQRLRR